MEVSRLEALGLVERKPHGREMRISRVPGAGWASLETLVQAYAPAAVLREALSAVPDVEAAFVFGSQARGDARPDSDIDVLIYGDDIPDQALGKALLDASLVLDRAVDAKRYDSSAWGRDVASGSGFLPAAMAGPKEWLIGSAGNLPATRKAAA
jgi:predicted nucleotidyltransferase